MNDATCGTYAGYQRHKRRGDLPCDGCRDANRRYMAEYRERPEVRLRIRQLSAARDRALEALRRRHPGEFERLFDRERRAET